VEVGAAAGNQGASGEGSGRAGRGGTGIGLLAGSRAGEGRYVGVESGREEVLALGPVAGGRERGRLGGEAQVGEDAVDDVGIPDDGDDLEGAGAAGARAAQDLVAVDAPKKVRPGVVGRAPLGGGAGKGRNVGGQAGIGRQVGNDLLPPAGMRGNDALVADERLAGRRDALNRMPLVRYRRVTASPLRCESIPFAERGWPLSGGSGTVMGGAMCSPNILGAGVFGFLRSGPTGARRRRRRR
jgi:hypothetical protein